MLVVVDMQPYFPTSQPHWLVEAVIKEIKRARKRGEPVILLEYAGWGVYGSTDSRLLACLLGYRKKFVAEKYRDNGGPEVVELIETHNLPHEKIRICGVNVNACVRQTTQHLTTHLPESRVKLVLEACNGQEPYTDRYWGNWGSGIPNLEVVSLADRKITGV